MRHMLGAILEYWPTIVTLVILAFVELRAPPWSLLSKQAIWVGLSGWIGTFAVYAIREEEHTLPLLVVFAVWTGFPIVLMLAGLASIRRLTRRPAAQIALSVALVIALLGLLVPVGLVLACGIAGDCL